MAKCEEVAGFLISAPCKSKAQSRCQTCNKGVCEKHGRPIGGDAGAEHLAELKNIPVNCITCHRKAGAKYNEDNDDPYLYSGFYYNDYYDRSYYSNDSWSDNRGAFDNSNQMGNDDDFGDDGDFENDFDGS